MSDLVRLFVADGMSADAVKSFEDSGKFKVTFQKETNAEELKAALVNNEVVAIRSASKIRKDQILEAKNSDSALKLIIRLGAGVDNIDVADAKANGIDVMNTASANALSAAEHTIAMMFAVARNVPQAYSSLKNSEWKRAELAGFELSGKTLGALGCGQIGRIVAQKAIALGMKVVGYDPFIENLSSYEGLSALKQFKDMDEMLGHCDLVRLHLPKLKETAGMINAARIAKMKPGAVLVNVARGGLEDVTAVLNALDEGQLKAYAVDVYEKEPPEFPSALINHSKVICTPHLGASTEEAQQRVGQVAFEQVQGYFFEGSKIGTL